MDVSCCFSYLVCVQILEEIKQLLVLIMKITVVKEKNETRRWTMLADYLDYVENHKKIISDGEKLECTMKHYVTAKPALMTVSCS